MQTDDLSIRIKVLDGIWEVFGSDRARGVWPENFSASSNEWGNDKASFDLRREPGALWPDLQAFNEVEVEVGGLLVWTGRILETPARDGADPVINVQCEGWQYHLDDDSYAKNYVHTKLADWVDRRTVPGVDLTVFTARLLVRAEQGAITLGAVNGTAWSSGTYAAITLDLGPASYPRRLAVTMKRGAGALSNITVSFFAHRSLSSTSTFTTLISNVTASTIPQTNTLYTGGASPTVLNDRYITIQMGPGAMNLTTAADEILTISDIKVFAESAYQEFAGGSYTTNSALKASQVVADAKAQATTLLSSDNSQIGTTVFSIPELTFGDTPQTPREVISAVNAFHNYRTQVDVEKRLIFQPRPSAPLYEIGSWPGSTFEDSSMNSGKDVYSRVLVTGTGPDGVGLQTPIQQGAGMGSSGLRPTARPMITNPSFDTDVSGYTWSDGSAGPTYITRDTSTFVSAPASGRFTGNLYTNFLGPFYRNVTYRLEFWVKTDLGALIGVAYSSRRMNEGGSGPTQAGYNSYQEFATSSSAWTKVVHTWTSNIDVTQPYVEIALISNNTMWIDDLAWYEPTMTIVERRGFRRTKILPVSSALTTAVADQIGSVYLAAHRTQPLRGQVAVTPGGVREVTTGASVHPARLLREPAQLLRLSHRIDPDTGAMGRDGTIASINYDHNTRTSTVALDSDRRNFEALIARYSAVAG